VSAQTGSYTLVLADQGKVVEVNSASAANVTVPPNASAAFPVGTLIQVDQIGAGQVTIVPRSGVTVNAAGGALDLAGQYSSAVLRKRATDTLIAVGDLV
jgi:hypothetical protein